MSTTRYLYHIVWENFLLPKKIVLHQQILIIFGKTKREESGYITLTTNKIRKTL